jgi:hypothetical protein
MRLALYVVLWLIALGWGMARGQAVIPPHPDQCWPIEQLPIRMAALGALSAMIVTNERQRSSATEWFNATAPFTSSETFDEVVLVEMPEGAGLILFGRARVICLGAPIPSSHWQMLKHGILGRVA